MSFGLNFPKVNVVNEDISKLSVKKLLKLINKMPGELDVFDASPPCQDFSTANTKRDSGTDRNNLYLQTIDLIDGVRPKVFIIENVTGMMRGKMIQMYNKIVSRLLNLPYKVKIMVLKGEDYGVNQIRRRVIVIGVRNDIVENFDIDNFFPTPTTHGKDMSVKSILPHLKFFSTGQFEDKIISTDNPVCTITKTSSMWVYEADGIRRKPTIPELKKMSGFPESFKFEGSYSSQFARIGNAVPPPMTEAIGKHIKENILTPEVLAWCDANPYNEMKIVKMSNSNEIKKAA